MAYGRVERRAVGLRLCIPFVPIRARPMVALARSPAALGGHGAVAEILVPSRGPVGRGGRGLSTRVRRQYSIHLSTLLLCTHEYEYFLAIGSVLMS